jgi:hypothetical protein
MTLQARVFGCLSISALVVGLSPALFGQDNPAGAAQDNPARAGQEHETTITGCLNHGTSPSQYVLADEKTGSEIMVVGPAAELDKDASNHTVKLTGTERSEAGKTVFTVTKIEQVAATCRAATKK